MATYYYNHKNVNFPISVTEETLMMTPHSFFKNETTWEESSINYFYDNVPVDKEATILDIGAQSGLYTLYAKYLPKCKFHAFEPFPDTYKLLNDNIVLNGIKNATTYNIGLSDCKGETTLNTSLSHNGLHTLGSSPLRFNDVNPIKISVDTIDNIFYKNDISVDFIKMDTEGWEYFILKGGEKTIQKHKPFIQIEWNEINMRQCGVDILEFTKYIEHDMGYKIKNLIAEELFLVPNEI